ncbi:MAG: P-type conjugative transfer protein TrbJ [Desulfuromonadales bacterium]|nr:P-type conjugative transfer protein TrbJ [Desulfuromonadales bacterium]
MKRWLTCLLLAAVICSLSAPAHAILGMGDIVNDPQACVQAMITNINMIRQYVMQSQQYSNQLKQYAVQIQNLQNLNYMVDLSGLRDMQNIIQASRGIANDYAALQRDYDKLYPEFSKFSSMSGKDYAKKAMEWNQQTANTNRDAMNLLSKSKDWFTSDSGDLQRLTVKANNVSGAKDAMQAAAQLSALQSKQLLQLQQTMSAAAKVEGTYMQQKAEQEAAASAQMRIYAGKWDKDVEKLKKSQQQPTKSMWK